MQKHYVHYGSSELIRRSFNRACSLRGKPEGFWASPADAKYGWKQFCNEAGYGGCDTSNQFKFTLSDNAIILSVHSDKDILPYILPNDSYWNFINKRTDMFDELNMDKLADEYDGIELFLSKNWSLSDGIFYLWDCDSIVIWNLDIIDEVKTSQN